MEKIKALLSKASALVSTAATAIKNNPKRSAALAILVLLLGGGLDLISEKAKAFKAAGTESLKALSASAGPLEGTQAIAFLSFGKQIIAKDVVIRLDGSVCFTDLTTGSKVCVMNAGPTVIEKVQ
jgi:hypothetical protein